MCQNKTLETKVEQWLELKKEEKRIKQELDKLKKFFISELEQRNTEEILVGVNRISYKDVVSNSFDTNRFKAENEEAYMAYLKENCVRRFNIY